MSDTSARHGPSPSASLNSVKLGQHQPQQVTTNSTADPSPPAAEQNAAPDFGTILLLALVVAVAVRVFWKALLGLAVIAVLTLVFAGILVPVMMMSQPH